MKKHRSIRVNGIHCANCVKKIERDVNKIKGISELHLSYATSQLNVKYDTKEISLPEIKKAVENLGYNVLEAEIKETRVLSIYNLKFLFTLISGILFFIGLGIFFFTPDRLFIILDYSLTLSELFFIFAMVFGGYFIMIESVKDLLRKEFAIESLMIVAAVGAVLINALPEAAAILFLYSIAELLESYATERSRRSIHELTDLSPKTVLIKKGKKNVKVPIDRVKPGDIAVVRSGQYIGIDGTVISGFSVVSQAPITGESIPVKKMKGDVVYAGTLNQDGRLEVEVNKSAHDTTLAKIIKLIESAEENKSSHERFMDRFAKYYTPSILFLAILVVVIPTFVFGESFDIWFYKALMLILISCPCALAISTPVAMVSAITNAARNGVLFKGGVYVERAAQIETIAFDKTGTLTTGKPVVTDIIPLKGHSKQELLQIASSLECLSKHPIGDALVSCAEKNGAQNGSVENFKTIVGRGVRGTINGTIYYVGGEALFQKQTLKGLRKYFKRFQSESKSVVIIGTKKEALGLIAFSDDIRYSSIHMLTQLRSSGVNRLVMLTGDNARSAKKFAKRLGIDKYHAGLLPHEKVSVIKKLGGGNGSSRGQVAMVGDGINDAPALAAADLGIAMGAAGSDTALETADIALMKDDLAKVPYLIKLGRKTMRVVKQNIIFAIGIKLLFAILVFPGLVTLWLAVAVGDMGVSLGVILNALRLGRV